MNGNLLELLVCPVCRGPLRSADGGASLVCAGCKTGYPVREGIPILLPEAAKPVSPQGADGVSAGERR